MYCHQCLHELPDVAKFCSKCRAPQSVQQQQQSPSQDPPPYNHSPYMSSAPAPTQPFQSQTTLINATGYTTPAFENLASLIFNALNSMVHPRNTNALEAQKLETYRTWSGQTSHTLYTTYVLPTYCSVLGIEVLASLPIGQPPTLTPRGWRQFLQHKINVDPDAAFSHVSAVLRTIRAPLTVQRADFPISPDRTAQIMEMRFWTQIQSMILQYQQSSAVANMGRLRFGGGFGGGAFGGGLAASPMAAGGGDHASKADIFNNLLKTAQGSISFLSNATGGGGFAGVFGGAGF